MVHLEGDQADRLASQYCEGKAEEKEEDATPSRPHKYQPVGASMISSRKRNNNRSNKNDKRQPTKSERCSLQSLEHIAVAASAPSKDIPKNNLKWWQRTRIHVALLGLAIAVVNCYAQATFCIAIVEMVVPSDYVGPAIELPIDLTTNTRLTSGANTSSAIPLADQSCPIEFKYRNYYDSWRFETSDEIADSESSNNSTKPDKSSTNKMVIQRHQSNQQIDVSNRFDWDASQQGLLLGAFAIGTAPLQIIGGRLAEIYGSKWVLLMGCIGTGLTNLAIPHLAHFSFVLLLANRILMGVAQAGMEPGLMCLLADWLTPNEASFFISMLLFAICLGFFLGSLCSSFILALDCGWPMTYYVCAGLNLAVALVWYVYADSWPRVSKYITCEELEYIESEQASAAASVSDRERRVDHVDHSSGSSLDLIDDRTTVSRTPATIRISSNCDNSNISNRMMIMRQASDGSDGEQPSGGHVLAVESEDPLRAPWLNILSSRPVWAFIICKISIRWCADVISNELPTYLANVLHLSIKINGLLNSVSSALFAVSSFVTGWLATSKMFAGDATGSSTNAKSANELNRNKTNLRKCFQSLASFGSGICLILMTRYDCDILISMSCLLMLSCFVVMGTGGELQIAYDMTSRYPGTLHGMACTLSVSGWLAPPLYGLILGDQPSSRSRWSLVWYSTAAINLLGGLIFVLFADASPRDFDQPAATRKTTKGKNKAHHSDAHPLAPPSGGYGGGHGRGYSNGALNSSSCESSPKSNHQPQTDMMNAFSHNNENSSKVNKLNPLESSMSFDCDKLIKCRQSESSFIQAKAFKTPGYCLDSPLRLEANDLIYPYNERETAAYCCSEANAEKRSNDGNNDKCNGSIWHRLSSLVPLRFRPAKQRAREHCCGGAHGSISGALANEHNERTIETTNQSRGSHDSVSIRFSLLGRDGGLGGSNILTGDHSKMSAGPIVGDKPPPASRQQGQNGGDLIGNAAGGGAHPASYRAGATMEPQPSNNAPTTAKAGLLLAVEAARQQKIITHL